MDKRQKAQKNKAKNAVHTNTNSSVLKPHDRKELNRLVEFLFKLTLQEQHNQQKEWEQYLQVHKLLQRIMELEAPLCRTKTNATPEDRIASIEAFYKWANESGLQWDGVRIAVIPGYELGLIATRDIAENELLFSIPRKLIYSEDTIDIELEQFSAMSNVTFTISLMLEVLKPESFWRPYINVLPERYSTVLYYTPDEMEELRGSTVFSPALRHCVAIARQYAYFYNIIHNKNNQKNMKCAASYDLYRWAVSTVMTRQNFIPDGAHSEVPTKQLISLIPFWDMANHRHGKITSFYDIEKNVMENYAQANFKAGEQIFIHYGDRPNADLLLHNGFINRDHPKDSVSIKLGLCQSDALYTKRSALLQLLSIPISGTLKVLSAPDYISPQLLAFVRIFNMNAEQLDHWIEVKDRAADLMHIDCALETILESKTWQYLQTRLMLLLRSFPTTLESDEEQLKAHVNGSLTLNAIKAMTLEYRVLEKRIFAGALDYCKQRTKT